MIKFKIKFEIKFEIIFVKLKLKSYRIQELQLPPRRFSPDNVYASDPQAVYQQYTLEEFRAYFGWWAGEALFEAAPQDSIEIESNRTEIDWIE